MKTGKVYQAAIALARRFDEAQVPYAIVGAMALGAHGYERMTSDVNVLVTRDGLARFKSRNLGLDYVEKFPDSKGLRDSEHDVNIDVLLRASFPVMAAPNRSHFRIPLLPPSTMRAFGSCHCRT